MCVVIHDCGRESRPMCAILLHAFLSADRVSLTLKVTALFWLVWLTESAFLHLSPPHSTGFTGVYSRA